MLKEITADAVNSKNSKPMRQKKCLKETREKYYIPI